MEQPPSLSEVQSAVPKPPAMSLPARLLNVFASPGEVFDDVQAAAPAASNWLVPALLFALVGVISVMIIFAQPTIVQPIVEQQAKKMDEAVKAGKMTQAQADQAEKFMGPMTFKIAGSAFAVIGSIIRLLWWALILWMLGKVLKKPFGYGKGLEVAGLGSMITVLGGIVGLLLIVNFSKLSATPSLGALVKDFDMTRKSHLMLGAANVFYFWQVGVLSVGLSRLARVSFVRTMPLVLVCWVLQELLFIFSGLGQFAL
jgi:hypothetical protein